MLLLTIFYFLDGREKLSSTDSKDCNQMHCTCIKKWGRGDDETDWFICVLGPLFI